MNGPATSYSNYISQPLTGARRSLSGNSGNAVVAPQIINQMDKADDVIAKAKRSSGDIVIRRHHSISSKKNQSIRSGQMNSSSQASNQHKNGGEGNVTLSSGSQKKKQTPHDPETIGAVQGSNGGTRRRESAKKTGNGSATKVAKKGNSSSRNTQIFTDHNNLSKSVSQRNIGTSLQTYDAHQLMMRKDGTELAKNQNANRSSQQIVSRQKQHRESQELFEQRSTSKKLNSNQQRE